MTTPAAVASRCVTAHVIADTATMVMSRHEPLGLGTL